MSPSSRAFDGLTPGRVEELAVAARALVAQTTFEARMPSVDAQPGAMAKYLVAREAEEVTAARLTLGSLEVPPTADEVIDLLRGRLKIQTA